MTTSLISRTGRVQSWLDNPESRLPVSCTVFVVEDEMEGPNGIEASWRFASHALRYGAGCAIHLSKLRPKGAENGKGLVASGPVSFAKIYSTLNEILSYRGSSDASTSPPNGGRGVRLKRTSFTALNRETSGSTK